MLESAREGRRFAAAIATLAVVALLVIPGTAAADVGYEGPSSSGAASQPTGEKPQSKMWVTPDNIWWASMFNAGAGRYEIHRLNRSTHTWSTTGTALDARSATKADTLWRDGKLYVASGGTASPGRVFRYSYNATAKSYTLDTGFPVSVTSVGMTAIVLDKDSTGKLWITYTSGGKVFAAHTTTSDTAWVTPYALPVAGASSLLGEDISAVVAYNGKIGILWSNQNDSAMYFASHVDGAADSSWTGTTVVKESEIADDHLNIKALQADDRGQLFAITKTSKNAAEDPLMLVHTLDRGNVWHRYTYGRVQDDHTRPMLMVDRTNDHLYVFASSPCCGGGKVYYKRTSLSRISFDAGLGTLFLEDSSGPKVNNSTGTKQELTPDSDLVALASSEDTKRYWHNELPIAGGVSDTTPPQTTITSAPTGTVQSTSATVAFSSSEAASTYECSLDGGAFSACTSPKTYDGLSNGSHTFSVRAADMAGNVDPTPATATWTVSATTATYEFDPAADAYVDQANPDQNFGSATRLSTDDNNKATDRQSFFRFSVAGVSGNVVSAKLRAHAVAGTNNGPQIFATGGSWAESGLTWNNRPALIGAASDDKAAITSGTYVDYDVTSKVTGDGSYAFATVGTSSDGMDVASREDTTLAHRPKLIVTVDTGGSSGPDTTPPNTTIDSGPSGTVQSSTASFGFSSNEAGSTFECRIDSSAFSACTAPKSYSGLSSGAHTFEVRAVDAAGNVDPTPAARTWTVELPSATEVSFEAEADTYASEGLPTTNFGTALTLGTDDNSGLTDEQSFLRFIVSGVSGTVVSAKVRAYVANGSTDGPAIFATSNLWTEPGLTWSSRPAPTGSASDDEGPAPTGTFVEYDVSAVVTGNRTYDFVTVATSSDGMDIASRETSDPSRRPQLVLTVQ